MADTFELEIVTPDKLVVKEAGGRIADAWGGWVSGNSSGPRSAHHRIAVGELTYRVGGTTHRMVVCWGFAEVLPERVTILAETCERPSEIDLARRRKQRRALRNV